VTVSTATAAVLGNGGGRFLYDSAEVRMKQVASRAPAGVYFYRLQAGGWSSEKNLVVIPR
jgi:hypothetical protein